MIKQFHKLTPSDPFLHADLVCKSSPLFIFPGFNFTFTEMGDYNSDFKKA